MTGRWPRFGGLTRLSPRASAGVSKANAAMTTVSANIFFMAISSRVLDRLS